VVTLLAWECGSHFHGTQKLEVHFHTIGFEHEATKMARVDQGLQVGSALPLRKGKCSCDALSCKAHCNYLPVVHLTGEESSIRVLPNQSLYNITLTPILRDEIITVEKNDEGVGHIKRRM
jgi:hypothetical protein